MSQSPPFLPTFHQLYPHPPHCASPLIAPTSPFSRIFRPTPPSSSPLLPHPLAPTPPPYTFHLPLTYSILIDSTSLSSHTPLSSPSLSHTLPHPLWTYQLNLLHLLRLTQYSHSTPTPPSSTPLPHWIDCNTG
jgi:hypothetical protein